MRSSRRLTGALLALGLAAFAYVTAQDLPIGLLPLMARDLGGSESNVGFLVSAYGLVVVAASIPLTHATRHLSRRPLLTTLVAIFAIATIASALAPTYETMLATRIVTALSQALFWSIVVPAAASLAPSHVRGRAIAVVFGGASLAAVAGVPVGAWLGSIAGWRFAFAMLAGLGVATCLALVALLPSDASAPTAVVHHEPRPRRPYDVMVLVTALVTTGSLAAFTYVAPFLIDVAGFPLPAVAPLLLLRGVAGIAGVAIGGRLADRSALLSMKLAIGAQAAALLGMAAVPNVPLAAVAFLAVGGLAFSSMTAALGSRIIDVAPGSVDLAAAGVSTAVNVGITAGALVGALLLPLVGVRAIVLVGALLTIAAYVVQLADRPLPAILDLPDARDDRDRRAA